MTKTLITPRAFTVDEYYRMAQVGILGPEERVELLEGRIFALPPKTPPHASTVTMMNQLFHQNLGGTAIVSVHNPVRLDRYSEPEPDVSLLEPREDFYASRHPGPDDALLLVEVADTTADSERSVKIPLYAGAGIPEVWLVNLPAGRIEVYRKPGGGAYAEVTSVSRSKTLTPLLLPDAQLSVADVLG